MTQLLDYPKRPPSSDSLICDDGEPMESARHHQQMTVLIESLEFAWSDRADFYVGGNMFLYFSEIQARHNDFRGPDVFVVTNTTRRERRAWVVWEEDGKAPDVIIELLSDKTEKVDRGDKMRIYARSLKVAEYFLFDPFSGVFEGYELDALHGTYLPKAADTEGRLSCERLGLYLGKARGTLYAVEADWLRWFSRSGRMLEMPAERARVEAGRADLEAQRADTEAQRANAEAQRADAEAQRADAEAQRANAEAQRANAEAQRAETALQRAAKLEAELAALEKG